MREAARPYHRAWKRNGDPIDVIADGMDVGTSGCRLRHDPGGCGKPTALAYGRRRAVIIGVALMAIRERQKLEETGAPASAIASSTARYLGLVWAWAALTLAGDIPVDHRNPVARVVAVFHRLCLRGGCELRFASMLDRDAVDGRADDPLVKFGSAFSCKCSSLAWWQESSAYSSTTNSPALANHADWAGCNIFFFGALAIAAISLDALRSPAHV